MNRYHTDLYTEQILDADGDRELIAQVLADVFDEGVTHGRTEAAIGWDEDDDADEH